MPRNNMKLQYQRYYRATQVMVRWQTPDNNRVVLQKTCAGVRKGTLIKNLNERFD